MATVAVVALVSGREAVVGGSAAAVWGSHQFPRPRAGSGLGWGGRSTELGLVGAQGPPGSIAWCSLGLACSSRVFHLSCVPLGTAPYDGASGPAPRCHVRVTGNGEELCAVQLVWFQPSPCCTPLPALLASSCGASSCGATPRGTGLG